MERRLRSEFDNGEGRSLTLLQPNAAAWVESCGCDGRAAANDRDGRAAANDRDSSHAVAGKGGRSCGRAGAELR